MTMTIITSLLDNDFYKFSMMQTIFHRFPDMNVQYELKIRNYPGKDFVKLIPQIEEEIKQLCTLRFTDDELNYLKKFEWFSNNFIEFLRMFKLDASHIQIWDDKTDGYYGRLRIQITGSWLNTILFEVPILAIVSELFSKSHKNYKANRVEGLKRIKNKTRYIKRKSIQIKTADAMDVREGASAERLTCGEFQFADFGTRRRFSKEMQDEMIKEMERELFTNFIGTSNVYFAKKYGTTPIGTMAHEYIMAMQAVVRLCDSQKFALENWVQEYRGKLGIALSDTIGIDAFLRDFDLYFAKLFDGLRHDSGDPYEWTEKVIGHYKKLGIEPKTKTAVYSDGLTFDKALDLYLKFREYIKTSFGIGTWLTNDTPMKAPQIVIKMTRCNSRPVAKVSDSVGKSMCPDGDYVEYLRQQFKGDNDDEPED
jgi:nicotinate phosphoribosyltransferase